MVSVGLSTPMAIRKSLSAPSNAVIRAARSWAAFLGVARAAVSHVGTWAIRVSICNDSRWATSRVGGSYTVGRIAERPLTRKLRAAPHSPARRWPARRWRTLSLLVWVRITRSTPSLSWATPRFALRRPSRYRSCSGVGGAGGGGVDSTRAVSGCRGTGSGCWAARWVAATQPSTAIRRMRDPLSPGLAHGLYSRNDGSRNLAADPNLRGSRRGAGALLRARRRGAAVARLRRRRRLPVAAGARRGRMDGGGGDSRGGRSHPRRPARDRCRGGRRPAPGRPAEPGPLLRPAHGRAPGRPLRGHAALR